jgi:hypothetical protein
MTCGTGSVLMSPQDQAGAKTMGVEKLLAMNRISLLQLQAALSLTASQWQKDYQNPREEPGKRPRRV